MKYTFIQNQKVKELLELINNFNDSLKYPNSENSRDERRYTEIYEEKILKLINKGQS